MADLDVENLQRKTVIKPIECNFVNMIGLCSFQITFLMVDLDTNCLNISEDLKILNM